MSAAPWATDLASPSQQTLFDDCQRKWAFRYLLGIKQPQTPSQALGTEVDNEQLQPYLRDGRPFDFSRVSGYIAAAGLAYLPPPKTHGLEVQKHFLMPSPTWRNGEHIGFGYQGYMDLWLPDSGVVPDMPGGAPFVGDFKTIKALKWAKSKEQLLKDNQAMLYATSALYVTGAKAVDLSWMYFQTEGARKAKRTYLRVVSDQVAEAFSEINERAIDMQRIRAERPNPLDLPPSPDQCEAFGGCPHRDTCNLSPAQIIEAQAAKVNRALGLEGSGIIVANTNSTPTANLLAQLAAQNPAAVVPQMLPPPLAMTLAQPAAPPVAPAPFLAPALLLTPPPQVAAPIPTLEEHIKENPRAAWLLEPPPSPDPRYAIVGKRPDGSNIYEWELNGQPAPINPPESILPQAPATGVTTATPAAEAPKPKRGRPRSTPAVAPATGAPLLLATTPNLATAAPATGAPAPVAPAIDYKALASAVINELVARLGAA